MPTQSKTSELFDVVCEALITKVTSGEATAAEVKNAIEFLKNNNITADGSEHLGLGNLKGALPFPKKTEASH